MHVIYQRTDNERKLPDKLNPVRRKWGVRMSRRVPHLTRFVVFLCITFGSKNSSMGWAPSWGNGYELYFTRNYLFRNTTNVSFQCSGRWIFIFNFYACMFWLSEAKKWRGWGRPGPSPCYSPVITLITFIGVYLSFWKRYAWWKSHEQQVSNLHLNLLLMFTGNDKILRLLCADQLSWFDRETQGLGSLLTVSRWIRKS